VVLQLSGVVPQLSGMLSQMSGMLSQMSGVLSLLSGMLSQLSKMLSQMSEMLSQLSGMLSVTQRFRLAGTWLHTMCSTVTCLAHHMLLCLQVWEVDEPYMAAHHRLDWLTSE